MPNDLELVHLAFNRVKELTLIYGDSIPHLISIFNEPDPAGLIMIYGIYYQPTSKLTAKKVIDYQRSKS
jgi:hypothetical protein